MSLTSKMFVKVSSGIFSRCLQAKFPVVPLSKTGTTFLLGSMRTFKTSTARYDLMEFFDDQKNWGEKEVKVGRSWLVDELRLKSNVELHKLWYVLLKERNMLLTMEYDAKQAFQIFPNPERLDKVEDSMENLETVVRERNKAYFLLETGETGERSGEESENLWGFQEYKQYDEYPMPMLENEEYLKKKEAEPKSSDTEKRNFYHMLRERQRSQKRRKLKYQAFLVTETLKQFPDCDHEALREKYDLITPHRFNRILDRLKEHVYENNDVPWAVQKWKGAFYVKSKQTWREKYGA